MASLPKLLTTRHLLSDDVGRAAEEALRNAQRLMQAGQLEAAHRVLAALVTPGPWRISKNSDLRFPVLWHLWWLEARLGVPPVLDAQAEAAEAHAKDVREHLAAKVPGPVASANCFIDELVQGRSGQATAKSWSVGELAAMLGDVRPGGRGPRYAKFRDLAEVELRRRARERALGNAADPGDHAAIADIIERA